MGVAVRRYIDILIIIEASLRKPYTYTAGRPSV